MSLASDEQPRPIQALRESPILALRELSLEETETVVILNGSVPTYYLKQVAQETLRPVLAGRLLINRVHVVRNGHTETA